MPLAENDLLDMDAILTSNDSPINLFTQVRQRFPGLSITRCDLSDLGVETPFRHYPRYKLFLVDNSEHCWRLTPDPARATGIVVARCKEGA